MDPSAELLAALSRRLRKIEGAAAQVKSCKQISAKEQVHVDHLQPEAFSPWQFTGQGSERRLPRRAQTQFLARKAGTASSSLSSTFCASTEASYDVRLDARNVEPAGAALPYLDDSQEDESCQVIKQSTFHRDVEAEAMRLRQLADKLRLELQEAQAEIAFLKEAPRSGNNSRRYVDTTNPGSQREAVVAQTQQLTDELAMAARERAALETRVSSLRAELERQVSGQHHLEEELRSSHSNHEELQRRLEALQTLEEADVAPKRTAAAVEEASENMSMDRALELAKWAAVATDGVGDGQEVEEEDEQELDNDVFEGPLAELRNALNLLQQAEAKKADDEDSHEHQHDAFQAPIADLQNVLSVGAARRNGMGAPRGC